MGIRAVLVGLLGLLLFASTAAASPSPWWQISTVARPTNLGQAGGRLALTFTNLGDAGVDAISNQLTITDELPDGVLAYGIARAQAGSETEMLHCELPSSSLLTCDFHGALESFEAIEVEIFVVLEAGAAGAGSPGRVSVSGANAPAASAAQTVRVSDSPAPFGIESFSVRSEEEGGTLSEQAGAHPFQITSSIVLNQDAKAQPVELPKDLRLRFPPGLIATAARLPRCSAHDFAIEACAAASAIGAASISFDEPSHGIQTLPAAIYNLVPAPGEPARFGMTIESVPILMTASLDSFSGAATLSIANISQLAGLLATTVTLWGVPGDARHDTARGSACLHSGGAKAGELCRPLADPEPLALLTLPSSCAVELPSTLELVPWNPPRNPAYAQTTLSSLGRCDRLPFSPRLTTSPTTARAHAPIDIDLAVGLDDAGFLAPSRLAAAQIAGLDLAFPRGLEPNPALASGLAACGLADLAGETLSSGPGEGCPEAAKVGTVEAGTPLFPDPIGGALFVATPFHNRAADARFALYAILKDRARGIFLVLPLRLDLDPATGRLSSSLVDPPHLPLSRFALHFNAGPLAPLISPPCGSHTITGSFAPSSGASAVAVTSGFRIDSGCEVATFGPAFTAGTASNAAGTSSSFIAGISSDPAEPNLAGLRLDLPPGVLPAFAASAICRPAATATAACPPESRIGQLRLALGSGPVPLWVPEAGGPAGAVYLAGPYRGAPYSLLIELPARAGPFDLGTPVLRAAVDVDPRTAQASVRFDQLPQILDGVPLRYRAIRLVLDSIRNPTDCAPQPLTGTATSSLGTTATLNQRFQAADCAALRFRPGIALDLSGGLTRNGHPGLRAVFSAGPREAALAGAGITLPAGELLDLHHLRALCPGDLAAERCPSASRVGFAHLRTPLLPDPLSGPVYLRSRGAHLPGILADLHSGPLRFLVSGTTTTAPGGRLRIRLDEIPDLPFSRATFSFAGGRRGIFVNSASLCGREVRADARLTAHNGRIFSLRPALQLDGSC